MTTAPAKPSIHPILSVTFVGTLGFSIVLPFLVFLVTRLGGNAVIYGIMGATYSFFQLIGAPILGRLSDRYGRKRILLLSQFGTLTSWAIFLIALYLPVTTMAKVDSRILGAFTLTVPLLVLFFGRALDGLTGGNISVANAYLADITEEEDRSANFGKMALSSNLGFILGPAIAGVLGATALGETPPVLAALLISVVASLIIAFRIQDARCGPVDIAAELTSTTVFEVMGQEQKDCFERTEPKALNMVQVLQLPGVATLLTLYFLVFLAFNFFYIAFPVHAATTLNWSLTETGVYFSVMGLMMALVQGPVLTYASKKWPDRFLVTTGSLLLAISFVFFTSPSTALIYTGTVLLAVGNGVMWPSLMAIISKATDPDVQGAVQGFAGSGGAVASILGLLVGGMLYGYVGAAVFLIAATVTSAAFFMSFALEGRDAIQGQDGHG